MSDRHPKMRMRIIRFDLTPEQYEQVRRMIGDALPAALTPETLEERIAPSDIDHWGMVAEAKLKNA